MNDKKRLLFGMTLISVSVSLASLLNVCLKHQIEVFQPYVTEGQLYFYCPVDEKKKFLKLFPEAKVHKTSGVIGFMLRELHRPFHLFLVSWLIFLYLFLSHTLFEIRFQSTSSELQSAIAQYLKDNGIQSGYLVKNEEFDEHLKQSIKAEFLHEIAWIEVHRSGSVLFISFNHKETAQVETFEREPLISTKHAVVVRFELLHGYKKVKLNQVVHPGDVLVEPSLVDSSGVLQNLYVSGTVYGMTWYTITSEMEASHLEVLDFLRLLYECRRQIEMEIASAESILKENILQVTSSEGKISMTVHYTCIEDITQP